MHIWTAIVLSKTASFVTNVNNSNGILSKCLGAEKRKRYRKRHWKKYHRPNKTTLSSATNCLWIKIGRNVLQSLACVLYARIIEKTREKTKSVLFPWIKLAKEIHVVVTALCFIPLFFYVGGGGLAYHCDVVAGKLLNSIHRSSNGIKSVFTVSHLSFFCFFFQHKNESYKCA